MLKRCLKLCLSLVNSSPDERERNASWHVKTHGPNLFWNNLSPNWTTTGETAEPKEIVISAHPNAWPHAMGHCTVLSDVAIQVFSGALPLNVYEVALPKSAKSDFLHTILLCAAFFWADSVSKDSFQEESKNVRRSISSLFFLLGVARDGIHQIVIRGGGIHQI
jgi:hypothetical protein